MSPRWLFFPSAAGDDWSDAWASVDFVGSVVSSGSAGSNTPSYTLTTGDLVGNVSAGNDNFTVGGYDTWQPNGTDRYTMYYTHGARWVVWYLDGHWEKRELAAWWSSLRTGTWPLTNNFFQPGYALGDYSPIVFAYFTADPGDVSTWTNYSGPTS